MSDTYVCSYFDQRKWSKLLLFSFPVVNPNIYFPFFGLCLRFAFLLFLLSFPWLQACRVHSFSHIKQYLSLHLLSFHAVFFLRSPAFPCNSLLPCSDSAWDPPPRVFPLSDARLPLPRFPLQHPGTEGQESICHVVFPNKSIILHPITSTLFFFAAFYAGLAGVLRGGRNRVRLCFAIPFVC